MARTLTAQTVTAANAEQTGEILLWAVKIEHDPTALELFLVNNTEDVNINGQLYTGIAFELLPPIDKEGKIGEARIRIDNVTQWLTPTIRNLQSKLLVTAELVSISNEAASPPEFDNVEISFLPMTLKSVIFDSVAIEGVLSYETFTGAPFPAHAFTPRDNPGAF